MPDHVNKLGRHAVPKKASAKKDKRKRRFLAARKAEKTRKNEKNHHGQIILRNVQRANWGRINLTRTSDAGMKIKKAKIRLKR